MFERFTEAARATVHEAHDAALAMGHERIGPSHLLLGVAAVPDGRGKEVLAGLGVDATALRRAVADTSNPLDGAALAAIGIDLEEVERRVEASFGPGALRGRRRSGRLPFSPDAKRGLELALRTALERGDRGIGSEHVLLGVLRTDDPALARVLDRTGISPDAVREALSA